MDGGGYLTLSHDNHRSPAPDPPPSGDDNDFKMCPWLSRAGGTMDSICSVQPVSPYLGNELLNEGYSGHKILY